jgi:hypothetical protein
MKIRINWDALGIGASLACAIHCALLPLVMSSLPLFGVNIIDNHYFEAGMVLLALIVGVYSLYHGYRLHHHRQLPVILFSVGMALLIVRLLFAHHNHWLLIPSVGFIVAAHFLNFRYCRQHDHAHEEDCNH